MFLTVPKLNKEGKFLYMSNCLVIMDMQKGFCNKPTHKQIADRLASEARSYDFDHIVSIGFHNKEDSLFETQLNYVAMRDEDDCELLSAVDRVVGAQFMRDTYSCFTPEFKRYIENYKVDKIYFAGADLDGAILASCFAAFDLGITPVVVLDWCTNNGVRADFDAAITILKHSIGSKSIIMSTELCFGVTGVLD